MPLYYSMQLLFSDDIQLGYRCGKVGEYLRESSPNKHILRSQFVNVWDGAMIMMIEPLQAAVANYPTLIESAMIAGDVVSMKYIFSFLNFYMKIIHSSTMHDYCAGMCLAL